MGTQWGQKWGQSAAATSGREGESARLAKRFGAGGGTRTLTGGKPHRILSPARLPVSPLRRGRVQTQKTQYSNKKWELNGAPGTGYCLYIKALASKEYVGCQTAQRRM